MCTLLYVFLHIQLLIFSGIVLGVLLVPEECSRQVFISGLLTTSWFTGKETLRIRDDDTDEQRVVRLCPYQLLAFANMFAQQVQLFAGLFCGLKSFVLLGVGLTPCGFTVRVL